MDVRRRITGRATKGFTLMELLGAVAILGIIMAVGFPAFASMQSNLRAMELNAKAQQVYNQVQSRLTSLQTDGSLNDLESALGATKKLSSAPSAPSAYTYASGETTDWSKYGMYEVASGDSAVTKYLVTDGTSLGASASLTGKYIIELSPSTAEVYAVYYWETDVSGSPTYATVSTMSTDELRSNHIGYYGGNSIDPAISHKNVTDFDDVGFSIVNKEELYVRVLCPDFSKAAFDSSKLSVTIKVSGTSSAGYGTATWSKTFAGSDTSSGFAVNSTTDEVDIILDSMRSGLNFIKITNGAIYPGTDVTVDISVTYNGVTYDKSNRQGMQSKTSNSYFESLDETATPATAKISAVRHLNNLHSSWNDGYRYNSDLTDIHKLVQTADIDFDGTNWASDAVSIQSRDKGVTTKNMNPKSSITPINLDGNFNDASYSSLNSYEGGSFKLKNFVISGSTWGSSGLFGYYTYFNFNDVFMTDTTVTGTSGFVGGLAGYARGGSFSNCHNDVTTADNLAATSAVGVTGSGTYVGGLIGAFDSAGSITNCSATTNVTNSNGNSYTGGLVGVISNAAATLANCSVGNAVDGLTSDTLETVIGGYSCGGMVGYFDGASIDQCSALADVTSSSSHVGGLVGYEYNSSATITNCVVGSTGAAVEVSATGGYVGGLVGRHAGLDIAGCTALAKEVTSSENSLVGGLVGSSENSDATITDCHTSSGVDSPTREQAELIYAPSGASIGGLVGYFRGTSVDGCSAVANVTGAGSFIAGLVGFMDNTGSTISNCTAGVGMSSLSGDGACVVSGYNNVGGLVGRFDGTSVTNCQAFENVSGESSWIGGLIGAVNGTEAVVYSCSTGAGITDGSNALVISGSDHVGGLIGIYKGKSLTYCSSMASVTSPSGIVGGLLGSSENNSGVIDHCTVGMAAANPTHDTVVSVTAPSGNVGGLVGWCHAATVSNCSVLLNVYGSSGLRVGGLIGRTDTNGVDIDTCSIGVGGDALLDVVGGWFTGGLVGIIPGLSNSIENSSATCARVSSTSSSVGGLVGEITNGSITNCYAIGNPDYDDVSGGRSSVSTSGAGYIGGLVGRVYSGSTYGCYTDATVSSPNGTYVGGLIGLADYGTIDSCYSSGDVSGAAQVGGFVGRIETTEITNCFTTSNVWGNTYVGGFLGYANKTSASLSFDTSYGRVRTYAGVIPSAQAGFGGFIGYNAGRNNANNLSGCTYLLMAGYNQGISNATTAAYQPSGSSYGSLTVAGNDASLTHAYLASLKNKAFPFAYASYNGSAMPYYGDWPLGTYHVEFVDHASAVLYEVDVDPGTTPTYNSDVYGVPSLYVSGNRIYVWNRTWKARNAASAGIMPATGDTIYDAQYVATPLGTALIAGGTSIEESALLWGSSGFFTKNGNTSTYTASPFSASAKAYAENGNRSVDSEADYAGGLANAATSVRNQLAVAGYPTAAKTNEDGTFSWRIVIYKDTIVAVPSGMESNIGYNTSTKSSEGGFLVLCGEKIPNASEITDAQKTATYQVIEFDAGRYYSGQKPYRLGTVKITNINPLNGKTLGYYVYNDSTFVADPSDWFTL